MGLRACVDRAGAFPFSGERKRQNVFSDKTNPIFDAASSRATN
jgi:hypothetical protein